MRITFTMPLASLIPWSASSPGMAPFAPSVIPDAGATLIAEYVLATFR